LAETGVTSLREELAQIGNQLKEISERLHGLELEQGGLRGDDRTNS